MRVRHVILDRDGVLNDEAPAGGYITRPESWRWISGSREALAQFARAGIRVSVATNQSGVGRGLMTQDDLDDVHDLMMREAADAGGHVDALFACTHAPGAGCDCRKPAPGLILAAIAAAGIPAAATLVIGDDRRDLDAAAAAGVAAALVLTGKGRNTAAAAESNRIAVYDDLYALALALLASPLRD